jgi:hypothetical protein
MNKLIRVSMATVMTIGLGLGLAGCSDEASDTVKREIKSPGGTTTVTDKTTVKTTGDNPPVVAPKNP